jgi:CO dehydrogenase maturation factor
MEAGLEHLSIGTLRYIDLLLVVVQPTAKTMMTADRTHKLALELGIPEIAFLGNRVTKQREVDQLEAFAAERGCQLLITIPEDDSVRTADMASQCLLDVAPHAEVIPAVARLADLLEARFLGAPATA